MKNRSLYERVWFAGIAVMTVAAVLLIGGIIVAASAADLPIPPRKSAQQQKPPMPKAKPPVQSDRAAGMP